MRAIGPQIGCCIADIACKRDADMLIRAGADGVITAVQLHFDTSRGSKRFVDFHNRRLFRLRRAGSNSNRSQKNEVRF
jgi:hypothetical protein